MPSTPPGKAIPKAPMRRSSGDPPRHRAIYEELLAEIRSGLYKAGERLPSEVLLCERFMASRITVAKAIHTLQRDQLVNRRPGSGTYVQQPANATPSLRFGLLIPDFGTTEVFEPICQGIMRSPAALSHSLTWGHSRTPGEDPEEAAERLCHQYIEQKVDGVFFAPIEHSPTKDDSNHRIAAMLERASMPVVLLDRCIEPYPDRSNFDLVGIDNHRAGYTITRHLVESGCRRIRFATQPFAASTVEARMAGYRMALTALGDGNSGCILTGDFENSAFVRGLLKRERPDGIVCANDVTAARLMQTIISLGVSIPGQVRIAGFDDVSYARYLPVPLTTIRQDCAEIGAVAMTTMLERLAAPTRPVRDIFVQHDLIVRASSTCSAGS